MNSTKMDFRHILALLLLLLLNSQCAIFSNQYGYNSSRGGGGGRQPQDRPLYEPENRPPTSGSERPSGTRDDEELFADEEEATDRETGRPDEPKGAEALARQGAVDYAKQFLGTKYQLGGTTPSGGFDCSGFTSYVMREVDVPLTRTAASQEKEGKKVKLKNVKPGDLIFYRRTPLGQVFHVSIVVDNRADGIHVIHSTSRGVVTDNISRSSYWEPKISSARDVISR